MYESFYGLRAKPFQLSPDPRFFFNSKGHRRALAYLRYGVRQGEGFIIVTGDVGTGKTTLVSALFRALAGENVVAAQVVTSQLHGDDLLRMVAAAYGLQYERVGKTAILRHLEEYFRSCVQEGKRPLLVVDEAQNLPRSALEELRMLSNFQWRDRPLLQSFLLGQKEFRITLRSEGMEQLRQRVIAAYHLEPLNSEETRSYIEHRLVTAGWKGDPSLREEIYPEIYRFTGGVPRRINTLCDRLLLFGYLEEVHDLGREQVLTVSQDIMDEGALSPSEPGLPPDLTVDPLKSAVSGGDRVAIEHKDQETTSPAEPSREKDRLARLEEQVAALREELSVLRQAAGGNKGSDADGETEQ